MERKSDKAGHFEVIGLICAPEFQKCRVYIERLHKHMSNSYSKPEIKALINLDWDEKLLELKRTVGGRLWALTKNVAVFLNGEYLGDDTDLMKYVCERYDISIPEDFHAIGKHRLTEMLVEAVEKGRQFCYLTISIDKKVIGSLLFELYSDLVPMTCRKFLEKCRKGNNGFAGRPVHRIVKGCWIQCGGWDIKHHRMPCENYVVPHDRRGVLSMCNRGKHTENSYQFMVTLDPASWMDYKYVAFGQLIHGNEVLKVIENVSTYYESPKNDIRIKSCGEFSMCPEPDQKCLDELEKYLESVDPATGLHPDILDLRDKASILDIRKYKKGFYSAELDMQSHLPFLHLPDYLLSYLSVAVKQDVEEEALDQTAEGKFPPPLNATSMVSVDSGELYVDRSKNFKFDSKTRAGLDVSGTPINEEGTITEEIAAQFALDLDGEEEMTEFEGEEGQPFNNVEEELIKTFADEELSVIYENSEPEG